MARELKVPAAQVLQDERLYLASPTDIIAVIRERGGEAKHVMVFGHNPGMTECANQLSAGDQIDNLPTCGVFTAQFDITAWSELDWQGGRDAEFDYPKNHP
jgi:phosphohistidine phosphatase